MVSGGGGVNIVHKGQVIATYPNSPTAQTLPGFEGAETVSGSSQHRPVGETRDLILASVEKRRGLATRRDIARDLKRAKTPFLISQIEALVEVGLLTRRWTYATNGREVLVYSIGEGV